ncbi:MAG: type 2 lantipeptide synthetase LanM [Proteobacteria bacterium]|nr:type 2 lantipeptide synthetase LanM [Pseudomonadota bacterium]
MTFYPQTLLNALNLNDRLFLHTINPWEPPTDRSDIDDQIKWWTQRFFNRKKANLRKYLRTHHLDVPRLVSLLSPAPDADTTYVNDWIIAIGANKKSRPFLQEIDSSSWEGKALCDSIILPAIHEVFQSMNVEQKIDKQTILSVFDRLLQRKIGFFIMPTLILEANISRLKSGDISKTPEERFENFLLSTAQENVQTYFWNKYPVLWRLVHTVAKTTTAAYIEVLSRVHTDRKKIEAEFGLCCETNLTNITWGTGDTHCGGKAVALLHFGDQIVVYKPRPLQADKAYNGFLDWFATLTEQDTPCSYKVVDCGSYGYVTFIPATFAKNREDISNFYRKIGMLIAISWVLGIRDLHYENLIASGSEPFLIDIESIFDKSWQRNKKDSKYYELVEIAFKDLLMGTGLIPNKMIGSSGTYDISAIGAFGKQPTPSDVRNIENYGRDDIKIIFEAATMPEEKNIPQLKEDSFSLSDYIDEMLHGFDDAISILGKNKDKLTLSNPNISSFKKAPVRWIARQTRDYARLLEKMTHPTMLKNAIDSDMLIGGELLDAGEQYASYIPKVIAAETHDLWNGDIPYFWTTIETRNLYSSTGKVIKNFFARSGVDEFERRVQNIHFFKKAQCNALHSALVSTIPLHLGCEVNETKRGAYAPLSRSTDELLGTAIRLGDRIIDNLHYIENIPFGIGFTPLEEHNYTSNILPPDFYDGISGIGIFFGYLAQYVKNEKFIKLAEASHDLTKMLMLNNEGLPSCGAYTGLSGLLYADMHYAYTLGRPISQESKHSFKYLRSLIQKDENYDLVNGSAGALLIMLRYYAITGDAEALKIAAQAARRLEEKAESQNVGMAWHTMKQHQTRLGGLSHGVTGIAWALAEWGNYTKEEKWINLAKEACAYEASFFDEEMGTWLDSRKGLPTTFWCYGAPGIGLGITHLDNVLGKEQSSNLIQKAKDATWRYGFSNSHCICHGNLGNAELFLATGDQETASIYLTKVLDDFEKNGVWRCALPGEASTPGMMCGLAGIGYSLLRHAFPNKLPNILNLELPQLQYC